MSEVPKVQHRGSMAKGAMESKKFLAFLVASIGWNILIGIGVFKYMPPDQWSSVVLLGMIVVQGTVQVGFILGQAGLDALTSLFDIITPDSLFNRKPPKE